MSRVSIKVANLRKIDPDLNLEKWLEDPNNVYVGRHGRIFIDKVIFHYKKSIWSNDYTVKDHGLERCLELYRRDISEKILKYPHIYDLKSLVNKNLGCFCSMDSACHVDILLEFIRNLV